MKNDGGPAYPKSLKGGSSGMSLRDYFAGQVLAGFASMGIQTSHLDATAKLAYRISDAMLKARNNDGTNE